MTASVARYGPHATVNGWWKLELQSWNGGDWDTVASANAILAADTVYPEDGSMVYKSLEYTADASVDGKEIRIVLLSSWGARILFDDVKLEVVPFAGIPVVNPSFEADDLPWDGAQISPPIEGLALEQYREPEKASGGCLYGQNLHPILSDFP